MRLNLLCRFLKITEKEVYISEGQQPDTLWVQMKKKQNLNIIDVSVTSYCMHVLEKYTNT